METIMATPNGFQAPKAIKNLLLIVQRTHNGKSKCFRT